MEQEREKNPTTWLNSAEVKELIANESTTDSGDNSKQQQQQQKLKKRRKPRATNKSQDIDILGDILSSPQHENHEISKKTSNESIKSLTPNKEEKEIKTESNFTFDESETRDFEVKKEINESSFEYRILVVSIKGIIENPIDLNEDSSDNEEENQSSTPEIILLDEIISISLGSLDSYGNKTVLLKYRNDHEISENYIMETKYHFVSDENNDKSEEFITLINYLIKNYKNDLNQIEKSDEIIENETEIENIDKNDNLTSSNEVKASPVVVDLPLPKISNTILDAGEENYTIENIDIKLKRHLQNEYFSDIENEDFVFLLRCSYIPYGGVEEKEKKCTLILTSIKLYIFLPWLKNENFYSLRHEIHFSDIQKCMIGLFYQYFRIQCTSAVDHVIITRNHEESHTFISLLQQKYYEQISISNNGVTKPLSLFNLNRSILDNMSDDLFASQNVSAILENYFLAYLIVPEDVGYNQCPIPSILQGKFSFFIYFLFYLSFF